MYRTDKQFMKNPATASSRIYIGALPKTIVADDLEAKFKSHGNILGLVLNTGFAFIQFEHDHEAHLAIEKENGAIMHGRKIIVKQALGGKPGPPQQQQQFQNQQRQPQKQGNQGPPAKQEPPPPLMQSKSPQQAPPPPSPKQQPPPPLINKSEPKTESKLNFQPPERLESKLNFQPPEREPDTNSQDEEMDTGPNIRPPQQHFAQDDDDRGRKRPRGGNKGGRLRGKSNDRFDPPPARERDNYNDRPGFYGGRGDFMPPPPENYGPPPPVVEPPPLAPERNDCEIIVVSRTLTEYAEFIESRLKQMGLIVDLLFPNEDVPIGKVLANISSRGCLYAILVMPQNEEHRSLTLNILHGVAQEHRNMPLEDALLLVSRNFEAYMRGENLAPEDPSKMSLADRHPTPLQMLFNLLAENRQLTTSQYDRLMKYLQDRRELQHEYELAEGINQDSSESSNKQTELQNRIMNILNKSNEPPIPTSITAPDPPPTSTQTPLLKDPTVQKALDSLLSGDMFKTMSGTA